MSCPFKIYTPVGSPGGSKYPINSFYGWRYHPIENVRLFHFGIDIAAPVGEYVRAAQNGEVISSRYSKTGGNIVTIKHDGNYQTNYYHLDTRLVDGGELVRAGDIIGTVGQTGNATGPHLHFELEDPTGEKIDPHDCYEKSRFEIPYGNEFKPPKEFFVPSWVWWTGGGILALITTGIIIEETKKDKKRPRT